MANFKASSIKKSVFLLGALPLLFSCHDDKAETQNAEMEVALLKKELELTKKELELKEREQTLLVSNRRLQPSSSVIEGTTKHKEAPSATVHDNPKLVVQEIFKGAKSGDFSKFLGLCDPIGEGDGDTKQLCSIGSLPEEAQEQFILFFKEGRTVGEPIINENKAEVKILFGEGATRSETINMVKRENKWYLSSM